MAKKLFIKTYGCQMNVYDSDRMTDVLAPLGYSASASSSDADMVIINTCHIREKAAEKVFSELGRLRKWKESQRLQGRDVKIAVAGCVAQAEGQEISRRAPWVDVVVGPQAYHRLPELITGIDPASRNAVIDTDFPVEDKFDFLPEEHEGPLEGIFQLACGFPDLLFERLASVELVVRLDAFDVVWELVLGLAG